MRRLTFLVAVALVAACSGAPAGASQSASMAISSPFAPGTPTVTPSTSPTETASARPPTVPTSAPSKPAPPTPKATGPATALSCPGGKGADGFVLFTPLVVAVDALNVRNEPCLAAPLIGEAPRSTNPLGKGTLVVTLSGPVIVDGYRWYAVGLDVDLGWAIPAAGWIAAGTTSDSWLRPAALSCPEPSLATIAALTLVKRLACYGSTSLTIEAHQAAIPADAGFGGGCGDVDPLQPAWLWCWNINYNFVNSDGGPLGNGQPTLNLFYDPARGIKPLGLAPVGTTGPAYEIVGHFGDIAAPRCALAFDSNTAAFYQAWIICETEFVVEALMRAAPSAIP